MAHPQSNFTSTFNGTPLGNAKLTLSVNGVDHEYTPSGNDQTVDINGNEVVRIDDPDFVQLLNVADADKCELIIKQDITADGAYRKYRLADCHVLNGDREWRFTCTAGNTEYILAVAEDGSVTPSQRLIPGASDDLPLEDGTASAGTSNQYSRKDHVHPHDSTKEDKSNKTSYIDPTINQSGNYLGGSAVNGFVEKRTFAISIPYGTSNSNTFTKILEFNETFDGSRTRGAIFARLKIQYISTSIRHRLREIDAYIGYELNGKKAFVTFGNCYNTLKGNDLKKLHIVTYDSAARCRVEVYLEHRELTAMTNWISVELCENFQILEQSWTLTQSSHSTWKIPLTSYNWDDVNGASVQPTAATLPTSGVLKTDSYIIQSGNQTPFTYVPTDVTSSIMTIAKLAKNSGDTRLVFKLYSSEGWVAVGKVKRVNSSFTLNFSAVADEPDFNNGVAMPYIYLSLLDGVYYVNLKIDSYRNVAGSIAIEVENMNKDWEFLGSSVPDSVGDTVSDTDTDMKADPTAEVIDQGTNVPAPTSSTKVLTKQVDSTGREFWQTEQMSDIIAGHLANPVPIDKLPTVSSITSGDTTHVPTADAVYKDTVQKIDGYANFFGPSDTGYKALGYFAPPNDTHDVSAVIRVTYTRGSTECHTQYVQLRSARSGNNYSCSYSVFGPNLPSTFNAVEFQVHYSSSTHNAWLYAYCSYGDYFGISIQVLSAMRWNGVSQMDLFTGYLGTRQAEANPGITKITPTRLAFPTFNGNAVGSQSQPVYVDANGQVQPCEPILLTSSGNLNSAIPTTFGHTVWYKWYAANFPAGADFVNGNSTTSVMQSIKTHDIGDYYRQICYTASNGIWTRMCNNGTWTTWTKWTD